MLYQLRSLLWCYDRKRIAAIEINNILTTHCHHQVLFTIAIHIYQRRVRHDIWPILTHQIWPSQRSHARAIAPWQQQHAYLPVEIKCHHVCWRLSVISQANHATNLRSTRLPVGLRFHIAAL